MDKLLWIQDSSGQRVGSAVIVFAEVLQAKAALDASSVKGWTVTSADLKLPKLEEMIKDQELEELVEESLKGLTPAAKLRAMERLLRKNEVVAELEKPDLDSLKKELFPGDINSASLSMK